MTGQPYDRYATHNELSVDAEGTALMGYLDPETGERDLTRAFGYPMYFDADEGDGKTTREWHIVFWSGGQPMVATIYDYNRDGRLHIGGARPEVVAMIHHAIRAQRTPAA